MPTTVDRARNAIGQNQVNYFIHKRAFRRSRVFFFERSDDLSRHTTMVVPRGSLDPRFELFWNSESEMKVFSCHDAPMPHFCLDENATHMTHMVDDTRMTHEVMIWRAAIRK